MGHAITGMPVRCTEAYRLKRKVQWGLASEHVAFDDSCVIAVPSSVGPDPARPAALHG
ncbi:hypothetical protein SMG44B_90042 [Stenotrophomonas maltophilia]